MFFDLFHDPAFAYLRRKCETAPLFREAVKHASADPAEGDSLPETAFAWPERRRYPIHSREHAILSFAYAKEAALKKVPEVVLTRIKEALDVYEVDQGIFEDAAASKVAADTTPYAFPSQGRMPVRNAAEVKYAEKRFLEQLSKLAYGDRFEIASHLAKFAADHSVSLQTDTLRLAGKTASNPALVRQWVDARTVACKDATIKRAFEELSTELKTYTKIVPRDALKLAALLGRLDEQAGLNAHYGKKLPDPMQSVFNTDKIAEDSVDLGSGSSVSLSKLAALPASFWEDLGGKELSDAIAPRGKVDTSKLAAIVETLPLDLKTVLRAQMRV
jgi:hypothetical protein